MSALRRVLTAPWLLAWVAAVLVWLAPVAFGVGQAPFAVLSVAFTFATFFVIVAIGQMLVVTLGPGNIDLSLPSAMTLAGTLAMKVMDGSDAMIVPGFLVALLVGLGVGAFNAVLIRVLAIPPIIATLSSSFVFLSAAIWSNRGLRIKPPPALAEFTTLNVAGVPVLAVCVVLLAVVMHVVLRHTAYGRAVVAIGQNRRAAHLAGLAVERVRLGTYVLSAVFAASCGALLSGFSGGAALNMGTEYLLASIAVVVIGGTSVAGGYANVPGLWGAALFLFMLVTMLNTFGFGAGIRLILTGVIIVAVVAVAGGTRAAAR